jgi:hypothetical protein
MRGMNERRVKRVTVKSVVENDGDNCFEDG